MRRPQQILGHPDLRAVLDLDRPVCVLLALSAAYQGHTTVAGRTTTEIAGYFAGLDLEPPGLVDVWAWRPDGEENWPPAPGLRFLGGVARKPVSRQACGPQ
jgi:hypothetical protein